MQYIVWKRKFMIEFLTISVARSRLSDTVSSVVRVDGVVPRSGA